MEIIKNVRSLISRARTSEAIDILLKYAEENDPHLLNNLIMIKARLKKLNDSINIGSITTDDANMELSKINQSTLKILEDVKANANVSKGSNLKKIKSNSKAGLLAVGAVIVAGVLYFSGLFSSDQALPIIGKYYVVECNESYVNMRDRPLTQAEIEKAIAANKDSAFMCKLENGTRVKVKEIQGDYLSVEATCGGRQETGWIKRMHKGERTIRALE